MSIVDIILIVLIFVIFIEAWIWITLHKKYMAKVDKYLDQIYDELEKEGYDLDFGD